MVSRLALIAAFAVMPALSGTARAQEVLQVGAAAVRETPPPSQTQSRPVLDTLWDVPTVIKGDKGAVLNDLRIVGRVHLDNYVADAKGTEDSDFVARRARLGIKARMFDRLEAQIEGDFNLEGGGPFYSRLTDAYLAWKFSDAAKVTLGKHAVKFTLDGATSSNELLTPERSNVANNLWFPEEYLTGASVSGKAGGWSYTAGLFSGGRGNREFGNFDGGKVVLVSAGRDLGKELGVKRALVRADYVYNQPDKDSNLTRSFKHVGSLVMVLDDGNWGLSSEFTAGDGSRGQSNVFGISAMPWINATPKLQFVGRYSFLKSDAKNGIRLGRYENVLVKGRGDREQEFYLGANYYIYKHKLKLQSGINYAKMRDRAGDGGAYKGITWTTALRISW